jgi:hypothetical protein
MWRDLREPGYQHTGAIASADSHPLSLDFKTSIDFETF